MEETILISESRELLHKAETALKYENHEDYYKNMSDLLNLLIAELVGGAPAESPAPGPEQYRQAAEPEPAAESEPAAEPEQLAEPKQQGDRAKSDAAARLKAGNSPW